ncbi:MAG: MerR family transcriptional regulator [Thaumarchaeota archaeon]|nr:MerR family transcriptional regulator [Nitrososphaerota archaeon]
MNRVNYKIRLRGKPSYKPMPLKDTAGLVYRAELLRRLSLPESRLDAYLTKGLLPFTTERVKERNTRYKYDIDKVKDRLKLIDKLQLKGLTLTEIKQYLDNQ